MLSLIEEANRINNVEVDLGDDLYLYAIECGSRGALFCHRCLTMTTPVLLPATEADKTGGRRRKKTSKVSSARNQEEAPPRTPLNKLALCPFCLNPSCSALVEFEKPKSRLEISFMKKSKDHFIHGKGRCRFDGFGEVTKCCNRMWM